MDASEADAFVSQIAQDWREAPLSPEDRALCAFAEKLTRDPAGMTRADVQGLHAFHFHDTAIHDAVQVISYFNYINRVADALGVENEDFIRPWEKEEG